MPRPRRERRPEEPKDLPRPGEPEAQPAEVPVTHVVVARSRGFAWVLPFDAASGMPVPKETSERFQCLPGVQVVVGDRVEIGDGYVQGVAPRVRTFSRAVAQKQQIMAAHVDRVVPVLAAGRGLREGFLMRALAACAVQQLLAVVVVNKMDLPESEDARERLALWRHLGVRCVATSAETGAGLDELTDIVGRGTSVLMGHSGVGKSSLINQLRPGAGRRTGELDWQGKGRHVTTMAEAIVAPGSMLIDLPGVREFGLWGASPDAVLAAFPDVKRAIERCRFPSCTHGDEEGCGVHAAIDAGDLDAIRAELCLRMQQSVALGTEGGGRI